MSKLNPYHQIVQDAMESGLLSLRKMTPQETAEVRRKIIFQTNAEKYNEKKRFENLALKSAPKEFKKPCTENKP